MNCENNIDLDFWDSSKSFFVKYEEQKSTIFKIFEELSNRFPNDFQKQYFTKTKGNKISQGYNLYGFPYQVLDLARDFDQKFGFNIRILNWVGNGFYIFVYVGHQKAKEFLLKISDSKDFENYYTGSSSFNYQAILNESCKFTQQFETRNHRNIIVFWEKLPLQEDFSANVNLLEFKIEKAFDITA